MILLRATSYVAASSLTLPQVMLPRCSDARAFNVILGIVHLAKLFSHYQLGLRFRVQRFRFTPAAQLPSTIANHPLHRTI